LNQVVSKRWQQADQLAQFLLDSHGGDLTVAMPLGLGKANYLINALYRLVRENPTIPNYCTPEI